MSTSYREILNKLRDAFPHPISNSLSDAYLVQTVARALDKVDALKRADELKGEVPILGKPHPEPLHFKAALHKRLPQEISSLESVTEDLVDYLESLTIWGHPRTQFNVVTQPSTASLIGTLLAGLFNPNLAIEEACRKVGLAEIEAVAITAAMIGYDPEQASGVFTFGGTGTMLYGLKVGLEKAEGELNSAGQPEAKVMKQGVNNNVVVFTSEDSHYCSATVVGWLGLGTQNLVKISTNHLHEIDIDELRERACYEIKQGRKIAAFNVTMGTTDHFGLDNLQAVVQLRDELVKQFNLPYIPHIHADAVIGWAWSVFKDYPLEENPLGFRERTVRSLVLACDRVKHLHEADSVGIDFHKTGFAPYISSLVLFKDKKDLGWLVRDPESVPYLDYNKFDYHPGLYTLETSRGGTGVLAALANLKLFGKQGWQVLLGHLVEMAQLLREKLGAHGPSTVLNNENLGTVTLFRVYPYDLITPEIVNKELTEPEYREKLKQHNEYNQQIANYLYDEAMNGRGILISLTKKYTKTKYRDDSGQLLPDEQQESVVALKSYILSPFVDEKSVEDVVTKVLEAREHIRENI